MFSWKRKLAAAFALVALIGAAQSADMRTWTDTTGRYKVEGKLVRVNGSSVTLQRPNGTYLSIAVSKLSAADRTYVKKELEAAKIPKEPGGKPEEDDPFKPGGSPAPGKPAETGKPGELPGQEGPGESPRGPGANPRGPGRRTPLTPGGLGASTGELEPSGSGAAGAEGTPGRPGLAGKGAAPGGRGAAPGGESGPGEPGIGGRPSGQPGDAKPGDKPAAGAVAATDVVADWSTDLSEAKLFGLGKAGNAFPLAVGSVMATPKPAGARPIGFPAAPDFFDKISGLAISVPSGKAVVGRINQRPGSPDAFSRFYVCDLSGEADTESTRIIGNYTPLALSDDGQTLLVCQVTDAFGGGEKLEFWSIQGKYKRLAAFTPYEAANKSPGVSKHDSAVKRALFAGPNQLVTADVGGNVVVWDVSTGKPTYQITSQRDADPARSPDGKFLAVATNEDVAILDPVAGKSVARLPIKSVGSARVAFSPNGKRLAHANMGVITVFDLSTGEQEKSFDAPFVSISDAVFCWADDGHVLAGDTVYSVEYGVALWKYNGGERYRPAGEYVYSVVNNRDRAPGALVPVAMPPARAVKRLDEVSRTPDFIILKPGSEIKIDAGGIADPLKQSQIRIALIKRAEAAGYQVADDAKVVLKAATAFGKEHEMLFEPFGSPAFRRGRTPPTKVQVRPFLASVTIEYEGKTAWRAGSGGIPFGLIWLTQGETIETHMKKYNEPNYVLFDRVKLPKKLFKPLGDGVGAGLGSSTITATGVK